MIHTYVAPTAAQTSYANSKVIVGFPAWVEMYATTSSDLVN